MRDDGTGGSVGSAMCRTSAGAGALGLVALALLHPAFEAGNGALTGVIAVPLGLAGALALAAFLCSRSAASFLALAGLFTVGQGITLQLVHAGKAVGYQHWLPPGELLTGGHLAALTFLSAQAVIVGWTLVSTRGSWNRVGRRPGATALVVLVVVVAAAAPSRDPARYAAELGIVVVAQAIQLANLIAVVTLAPGEVRVRVARWLAPRRRTGGPARWTPDGFAVVAATWVALATALLAVWVYGRHPHIPDEIGYLVQARYFSHGMLELAAPPVPAAFHLYMFSLDAHGWYSALPPGWAAVLALGWLVGPFWLVNPLLSGVNVLLAHRLLEVLYGRRTARLGVLLLALSPWFLFMGMSLMNHQWAMTCALVAALGMRRVAVSAGIPWRAVVSAGVALGMLGAIRPLEAVAVAGMLGIAVLVTGRRSVPRRLAALAVVAAVALVASIPHLAYNRHFTGSLTRFPVTNYLDVEHGVGTNRLGFGPDRGFGWTGLDPFPGHGARDVVVNTLLNLSQVNVEMLGWSIGSVLVVALFLAFGRKRKADWLMIGAVLAITGIHSFYWFAGGPDFGARYWYLVLLPGLALTVRGLPVLGRLAGVGRTGGAIAGLLLALSASATFLPWRAADKYHGYRGMSGEVRRIAEDGKLDGSLILVRGGLWPDYASVSVYNPLDLNAPAPVFAYDAGPSTTAEVLRHYADRAVWVLDGPTITGDDFRLVRGPVPAERMLEELGASGVREQTRSDNPGRPRAVR